MTDPLNLVVNVVNQILALVKEAKTNEEDCQLLATLAQQTLSTLEQLENRDLTDPLMTTALEHVHEALSDAHDAIEECCKSNFFLSLVHRENYASSLKEAAGKLEHALSQVSVASVGMTADIQSELVSISDHLRKAKFNERAEMAHQTKALKDELEKAFFQGGQGTEEVKSLIREMMQKHSSSEEERKNELATLREYANNARIAKEKQDEFELNQIIAVLTESLEESSGERKTTQDLKDCLCCPISKEVMRDPVVLKESGMIYDRSSIEEWLRRGHHHDPLTNIEIMSGDFFPCHALRGTCQRLLQESGASSSIVDNHQIEESKAQMIDPGLYEGHGKLMIGSSIIHASQVFVLQPNGVALGCCLYEIENNLSQRTKLEFGSGEWNGLSLELSFEDDCYFYSGKVNLGINGRYLGMEWTGKVSVLGAPDEKHNFVFVLAAPYVSHSIWARPGILQMEGDIVSPWNNVKYSSKLVLVLEADFSTEGCMWFESASSESHTVGYITRGSWDSNDSLAFNIKFTQANEIHRPRNDPTDDFDCFRVSGALLRGGQGNGPVFRAMVVKATSYGTSSIARSYYVPLEDVKLLEYSYVRESTTPWFRFVPGPLDMFQPLDGYKLESGEYFIRADLDLGSGLLPYYLSVWTWKIDFIPPPDTHSMWAFANHTQGQDPWHFGEIWKVDKVIQENRYKLSIKATHKNVRRRMDHVGKSLTIWQSGDDETNRCNAYLCARTIQRIEEQPEWTIQKRHGCLYLLLEGEHNPSIGENKEYFVSNPIRERDLRNSHSVYAPVSPNAEDALKIVIEPARY